MKKVLLIGIGGVFNYGCEAIVRGTVEILRSIDPKIEIAYASYNYEYDRMRLEDLNINIIKRFYKYKRWTVRRIMKKICSVLNLPYYKSYDSIAFVNSYDCIISIGGDIYTLNSSNNANLNLPKFIDKCLIKYPNIKYILWGASVGPFDKNPLVLNYYKEHLKKADLIVAREENTVEYLNSIGINKNVIFHPDPAYFVPTINKSTEVGNNLRIGLNLSPLSAAFCYNSPIEAITEQAKAIERLIEQTNAEVILIPHVLAPYPEDDDLSYLNKVYRAICDSRKSKVKLITSDDGFIGRKKLLATLDFMIAARMHCGINAVTCGVPTIFLSYSAKARGMCKYIYGNEDYVCPVNKLSDTDEVVKLINLNHIPRQLDELKQSDFSDVLIF